MNLPDAKQDKRRLKVRHLRKLTVAGGVLAVTLGVSGAIAAPLAVQGKPGAPSDIVAVQWRGDWHHRHHHRGWRHGYPHRYSWGPALGGLAAGAVIGGAIANSRAQAAENDAYCSQRFRSYDPGSGTYLGYDGQRHPCP
ncbi:MULTISPECIES: BA14K family protein [unclassified Bradyrhizobium]|uniref:BA14K family protein n=1 Tax=unclassified Bradyrhizobium TaxID=2631580 RepID=UPI00211EAACA|nr:MULTISPECIES: BA14K family protein [unclassified Bradyrhizobium]MDD1534162.1 BA14K family protein [Bradyrhizobium sp. WBOS8]MDD1583883.1 BA14K family protein [Bradyrhizobium sp. WBOS4]UUO46869.1 BA14K family protein [Bradyrhizobium sp. WBOS04]UUO60488.1 BA14K family protein [Bradyrhizobium sp. WBOS08]